MTKIRHHRDDSICTIWHLGVQSHPLWRHNWGLNCCSIIHNYLGRFWYGVHDISCPRQYNKHHRSYRSCVQQQVDGVVVVVAVVFSIRNYRFEGEIVCDTKAWATSRWPHAIEPWCIYMWLHPHDCFMGCTHGLCIPTLRGLNIIKCFKSTLLWVVIALPFTRIINDS